jgi:hypothetical protein
MNPVTKVIPTFVVHVVNLLVMVVEDKALSQILDTPSIIKLETTIKYQSSCRLHLLVEFI